MSRSDTILRKRNEGRDEPIREPDLQIVDAHHHLYNRETLRYMFEEYLDDAYAGHNIVATVYIETKEMSRITGPEALRPVGEIEFANGIAAMSASGGYGPCRVAAAIVGYADLRLGDNVAHVLDAMAERAPDRFRGIRNSTLETTSTAWRRFVIMPVEPTTGMLSNDVFRSGFRHLAPRGLSYDASVFHNQLGDLAELADAYPDTSIVLGHMGMAMALDLNESERAGVFDAWRTGLREVAHRPNVVCKVGGLGLPFWGFGFEERPDAIGSEELARAWRPYVETSIETFGVERCVLESNFPPDGRSCGFVPLWNALKYITKDYSDDEKLAMYRDNAARVYRISPTDLVLRV